MHSSRGELRWVSFSSYPILDRHSPHFFPRLNLVLVRAAEAVLPKQHLGLSLCCLLALASDHVGMWACRRHPSGLRWSEPSCTFAWADQDGSNEARNSKRHVGPIRGTIIGCPGHQ